MDNLNYCNLRCPNCHAQFEQLPFGSYKCPMCSLCYEYIKSIPLLVKYPREIEQQIHQAKAVGRAEWYDSDQIDQWSGPYRHHLRKRLQFLQDVIDRYLKIQHASISALDLGCGDGGNLSWLMKKFPVIYGCDYNLSRLLKASRLTKDGWPYLFMADVTDFPALDNTFDFIFFNHVLEHIPNDRQALMEVQRILKPRGLLIIGVPNEGAFFWQMAYRFQSNVRATTDHVHFYTANSISAKCRDVGLRVEKVKHIGWGVPHWTLDSLLRRYKFFDDLFELIGKAILKKQATSLYVLCRKVA